MTGNEDKPLDVDQFLQDQIETVPHLEALLLIWDSRPKAWSVEEMAGSLFVARESAQDILNDLLRRRLINPVPGASETFRYESDLDRDRLLAAVDSTYRRELIRISRMIHSKPPAAVREFARAFRVKKDRE